MASNEIRTDVEKYVCPDERMWGPAKLEHLWIRRRESKQTGRVTYSVVESVHVGSKDHQFYWVGLGPYATVEQAIRAETLKMDARIRHEAMAVKRRRCKTKAEKHLRFGAELMRHQQHIRLLRVALRAMGATVDKAGWDSALYLPFSEARLYDQMEMRRKEAQRREAEEAILKAVERELAAEKWISALLKPATQVTLDGGPFRREPTRPSS